MSDWFTKYSPRLGRSAESGTGGGEEPSTEVVTPAEGSEAAETGATRTEPAATPSVQKPWFERRIGQLTAKNAEKERELAELRAQLAQAKGGETPEASPEFIPVKNVREVAQRLALEMLPVAMETQEFNRRCNEVARVGLKELGQEFQGRVEALNAAAGGQLPEDFLQAVLETDKPHAVLYALSEDMDRAVQIMALTPARQGAAVMKFEREISAKGADAPPKKRISEAPAPKTASVGGGGGGAKTIYDEGLSMKEFAEMRAKQLAKK
jgi:hypothetical protein